MIERIASAREIEGDERIEPLEITISRGSFVGNLNRVGYIMMYSLSLP